MFHIGALSAILAAAIMQGLQPQGLQADKICGLMLANAFAVKSSNEETTDTFLLLEGATTPEVKSAEGSTDETVTADETTETDKITPDFALSATSGSGDTSTIAPVPEVGGAESVIPYGELVQLWIKPPAAKPANLHSVAYSWTVLPRKPVVVWPDATRVIFASGTKTQQFTVVVTANYVYVTGESSPSISQQAVTNIVTVNVGDAPPINPPVDPPVNPPVDPPVDPNVPTLSGLSKMAYDWTSKVVRDDSYSEEAFHNDLKALAESFKEHGDKAANGDYTNINTLIRDTKQKNDSKISNRNAWLGWFSEVSKYLNDSFKDGTLTTVEQYSVAWKQIATGLESVK